MQYKLNYLYIVNMCLLCVIFCIFYVNAFSQGAAINTTGAAADPSSMLDISSANSGILIPRLTEVQKNAISNPATGLMIYQTDGVTGFWYYDGVSWKQSLGTTGPTGPAGADGPTGPAGAAGFLSPGNSAGNTPYWDGSQWVLNSSNIFNNGGSVGIGTTNPDASAALDISNSSKGTLITRMSAANRNAISSPASGLLIFNTTSNCFEFYLGGIWQTMACGCSSAPSAPTSGTHTPSTNQIVWNWNASAGATGYKWNTANNYLTATDIGSSLTYTQAGLNCGTNYTLYVWAYNNCGNSSVTTLTSATSACPCGYTMTVTHTAGSVAPVSKTVSYGTVSSALSGSIKCWITQNLGSDNQATAAGDGTESAAGWYWQFNRAQGYKHDGVSTRTPSTAWISSIDENYDWQAANDPCTLLLGSGWRLPTYVEWNNAKTNGGWSNFNYTYSSDFKLHAAGCLSPSAGAIEERGTVGYYSSSTQNGTTYQYRLYLYSGGAGMTYNSKAYGNTARCLKD